MKYKQGASSEFTEIDKTNSISPFTLTSARSRSPLRAEPRTGSARGRTSALLRPHHSRPLRPRAPLSRAATPLWKLPVEHETSPQAQFRFLLLQHATPVPLTATTGLQPRRLSLRPLFKVFSPEAGLHRCTAPVTDRPCGTSWEMARVRISASNINYCDRLHSIRAHGHDTQAREYTCHQTAVLTENLVGWDGLKSFRWQRLMREVSSNPHSEDLDVIPLVFWNHRRWEEKKELWILMYRLASNEDGWERSMLFWNAVSLHFSSENSMLLWSQTKPAISGQGVAKKAKQSL